MGVITSDQLKQAAAITNHLTEQGLDVNFLFDPASKQSQQEINQALLKGLGTTIGAGQVIQEVTNYDGLGTVLAQDRHLVVVTDQYQRGSFMYVADSKANPDGGVIVKDAQNRIWVRIDLSSPTPTWFGAKADGTTDDTVAVKAYFAAGFQQLNASCLVTDPTMVQLLTHTTGNGGLIINGVTYPAGDVVNQFIKLHVPSMFADIDSACRWLDSRRILGNSGVDIIVDDGTYNTTAPIQLRNVDAAQKVTIRGNETDPSKCIINVDNSNNVDGFLFKDGFGCAWLNGFRIQGTKGWVSKGVWNDQIYGAGVRAIGGGAIVTIGAKMQVDKMYYGIRSMEGAVIHANAGPTADNVKGGGIIVTNAGDVAFHAYAATLECNCAEAYDTAHNTEGLGFGFCAEAGGLIICEYSKAAGNLRAGHYALSKGTNWAHGIESSNNTYGVLSWGGHVECNSLGKFQTNIFGNQSHGIYSTYGGFIGANSAWSNNSVAGSGIVADKSSQVDITATQANDNAANGYLADGGQLFGDNASATGNKDNGFVSATKGLIHGNAIAANGNTNHGYYAKTGGTMIVPGFGGDKNGAFCDPVQCQPTANPIVYGNGGSVIFDSE